MEQQVEEKEKAQPASNLLDLCPKLAPRWAKTYVKLWKTQNPDVAKMWGRYFLRNDSTNMKLLQEAAKKELARQGLAPPEPPAPIAA